MEIPFDLNFNNSPVQRFDKDSLKWITPGKNPGIQKAIDKIGKLSAEAQGLRKPLTTFDKLADCDDDQAIYLMWKKSETNFHTIIIGFVKTSKSRKLYLTNDDGKKYIVEAPICVLDFFVHPNYQKQGYAHVLFNNMLAHEQQEPYKCAFDKPSEALLKFLEKNYGLKTPIWQSNNFVVFSKFFEGLKAEADTLKDDDDCETPFSARIREEKRLLYNLEKVLAPSTTKAGRTDSIAGLIKGDTKDVYERHPSAIRAAQMDSVGRLINGENENIPIAAKQSNDKKFAHKDTVGDLINGNSTISEKQFSKNSQSIGNLMNNDATNSEKQNAKAAHLDTVAGLLTNGNGTVSGKRVSVTRAAQMDSVGALINGEKLSLAKTAHERKLNRDFTHQNIW